MRGVTDRYTGTPVNGMEGRLLKGRSPVRHIVGVLLITVSEDVLVPRPLEEDTH